MRDGYSCKWSAAKSERDKVLYHPHCCSQELLSSFVGLIFIMPKLLSLLRLVKIGSHVLLLLADRDIRKRRFLFSLWELLFEFGSFKRFELLSGRRLAWVWDC